MVFSILKCLLSFQRYLSLCVEEISKLMTSAVVPLEDGSQNFRAKLQSEKIIPETNLEAHQRSMHESFCVMQISKLMTLSVLFGCKKSVSIFNQIR